MLRGTFLKVLYNIIFIFETFAAYTTVERLDVRVYQLMQFYTASRGKTLGTFAARIRLPTFVL